MTGGSAVRVLIADDDPLARTGMRLDLERQGMEVVGEAASAPEALTLAEAYRPEVVVLDAALGSADGPAPLVSKMAVLTDARVVLLAPRVDLELAVESLEAGARGVMERRTDGNVLARVLRAVAAGELAIPRRVEAELIEQLRGRVVREAGTRPVKSMLTQREWEVLDLLSRERSTSDIAQELFVAEETVRSHVKHILRKLRVSSRAEAVAVARSLQSLTNTREPR